MGLFRTIAVSLLVCLSAPLFAESPFDELLKLHNEERESLGLKPLEWSEVLQQSAEAVATEMAFAGEFYSGSNAVAENIWQGEEASVSLSDIFVAWTEGKQHFDPEQAVPENCKAIFNKCASYSQIIWSETTHIGCAAVASEEKDYIVCHYDPAGNVQGQKAY